MPFTVSHAAAALPVYALSNRRLPLAALMIGSMSPDFAYFFSFAASRMATHSFGGLFYFCLPVGLAVWWIFVRFIERPTLALVPEAWRAGLPPPPHRISYSLVVRAALAVVLGAVTHVVWDWFTHASTPVADAFPALRETPVEIGPFRMPLYYFLQILSSVIGLVALAAWAWRLRAPDAPAAKLPALPVVTTRMRIVAATAFIVASLACALLYAAAHPGARLEARLFYMAIGAMTGWLIAWCGIATWINARGNVAR